MATQNNETVKYKNTRPRQKVWNYMRRNRSFRFGDIMMICEISQAYLQNFLRKLLKIGYIRHDNEYSPLSNRRYTLIKNTGKIAPSLTVYGMYDNNTRERFEFIDTIQKEKYHVPPLLIELLKVVDCEEMTKEAYAKKANTSKGGLDKYWKRLKKIGVVIGPAEPPKEPKKFKNGSTYYMKYKKDGRKVIYSFNIDRAKEVLKELENGAYKKYNTELKHLWVEN